MDRDEYGDWGRAVALTDKNCVIYLLFIPVVIGILGLLAVMSVSHLWYYMWARALPTLVYKLRFHDQSAAAWADLPDCEKQPPGGIIESNVL